MEETKTCPKCNGSMTQGRIMKFNEHSTRNQYIYFFAPNDESRVNLARVFTGKPISPVRKALIAFCCEECGFTEFYSQTIE